MISSLRETVTPLMTTGLGIKLSGLRKQKAGGQLEVVLISYFFTFIQERKLYSLGKNSI